VNYLKDKIVYLCGPIHAAIDDGMGWRNDITPKLQQLGLIVDDPCKKTANGVGEVKDDKKMFIELVKSKNYSEAKKQFYPIIRKDLRSVDKADFLIVVYDPTLHLVGTLHEIFTAHIQRKPILLWYDGKNAEKFNPWTLNFVKENMIFTNWEDMFKYLHIIDGGNFDSSYWTL
jgi:hypothetical protein